MNSVLKSQSNLSFSSNRIKGRSGRYLFGLTHKSCNELLDIGLLKF